MSYRGAPHANRPSPEEVLRLAAEWQGRTEAECRARGWSVRCFRGWAQQAREALAGKAPLPESGNGGAEGNGAPPPPPPADDPPLSAVERAKLQQRIDDLTAQLRDVVREEATAERVREAIFGLTRTPVEAPSWVAQPPRSHGPGVPTLMLSDLHWGEVVRPEECGGVNRYDLATARARLRNIVQGTIDLARGAFSHATYPGIVVQLGGDLVSGDIHDELSETNELPTAPIVVDLVAHLGRAIEQLADAFGRVWVPCVAGNHGRMTHKPRFKRRAWSNFDWLVATWLEQRFKDRQDDRVRFLVPDAPDVYYALAGVRYLLTHGDQLGVKGGDGIIGALGPIKRGSLRITDSGRQIGREIDCICMGHWHQFMAMDWAIVNGSLKGYDEYAAGNRFRFEAARQALWFTHADYGPQFPVAVHAEPRKASGVPHDGWVSLPGRAGA